MNIISQPGSLSMTHELSWFQLMDRHSSLDFVKLLNSQPAHVLDSLIQLKNSDGLTLLLKACIKSDALLVAALLMLGSPYDIRTANGLLPIHVAASKGQLLIIEMLRRAGMQLDSPDFRGRLIIHYAAEFNQVTVLAYLRYCTHMFDPNVTDNDGLTPLQLACIVGSKQAVQYLLDYFNQAAQFDGSPNVPVAVNSILTTDSLGNTCLHSLVCSSSDFSTHSTGRNRASEILWILLTSLPNYPPDESPILLVQAVNKSNQSALDLARQAQLPKSVLYLLNITCWLLSNYDPTRTRTYLIYLYSLIWIVAAIVPLLTFVLSAFLVFLLDSNWPYVMATVLILFYATKQRHRLRDGTNRPNPFFAGTVMSGFLVSVYCYLTSLLNFNASISPTLPVLIFIGFALVAPLLLLILIKLLSMDPGKVRPTSNSLLLGLIQTQLDQITCLLDSQCHRTQSEPRSHFHLVPFVDLYCPHCNLVNPNPQDFVKHCKLCESCFPNMDHHCLFILNCVARSNHRYFIMFIILVILFTTLFVGACSLTFVHACFASPWGDQMPSLYSFQLLVSNFPLPIIMVLFNLFSWFWAVTLLLDQLNSIVLNQPTRFHQDRPRKSYSRRAWLRHWRAVIDFIVFDKRLITNQTDEYL